MTNQVIVVGITADADHYHLKCAIDQYGEKAVRTVYTREQNGVSDDEIIAAFLRDEWPIDREGNPIRALVSPRDDASIYGQQFPHEDEIVTQYPAVCGKCLHYIATEADIRAHGGVLDDGAVQF